MTAPLEPGFGLRFDQFHERPGLEAVDAAFLTFVADHDSALASRLLEARERAALADQVAPAPGSAAEDRREEAALLFALAPPFEVFIAQLFGIDEALEALRERQAALEPLVWAKWKFVKRQALLTIAPESLRDFDPAAAAATLGPSFGFKADGGFDELVFARRLQALGAGRKRRRGDPPPDPEVEPLLEQARRYAAWAAGTDAGRRHHRAPGREATIFRQPQPIVAEALIDDLETVALPQAPEVAARCRDAPSGRERLGAAGRAPFDLTDRGPTLALANDEVHYCLYCHENEGDTCSRGIIARPDRAPAAAGPGAPQPLRFVRSVQDVLLAGCPLEERISEFQWLKARQLPLAALAVIVIDNPMVAGTGHRICNDCMKACVFQTQTPVDIPAAESRTLRDVLELPWGVEIYSLLTRWNPMKLRRWLPEPDSGYEVLVAGLGPAGYTLAHHLLNAGHRVLAIDALKIEPLPPTLVGADPEPVRDIALLEQPLSDRAAGGFGGVAEYGITVRWDKNNLTLIRLLLERRCRFRHVGGTRFGSQLGTRDAFAAGFDHIALCLGAGSPRTLTIENGLADGVRTASDFLMALQLTGAARADSLANLQVRLPVVVVGGGLTAVDTATEALAYYATQVEKFLVRHETLEAAGVVPAWEASPDGEDREIALEFIAHARALRAERARASAVGETARVLDLLQSWGGSTIVYRRRLIDSPAYRLNHEELQRALGEGIRFVELRAPRRFEVDASGAVTAVDLAAVDSAPVDPDPVDSAPVDSQSLDPAATGGKALPDASGRVSRLAARTIFVAAGTAPNTVLADEEPDTYLRATGQRGFVTRDRDGHPVAVADGDPKPSAVEVFVHREPDGRLVSALGDLHPSYAGNVVKAMASARQAAVVIDSALRRRQPTGRDAAATLGPGLVATVRAVRPLARRVHEVVVAAPLAARRFAPGSFYRLQNVERLGGQPAMEGLALTGASVDRDAGTVSLIVLEIGASSRLSRELRPAQSVVLMGPVGKPTEIRGGETVLLVGGGLGNAVLFSIGAAFREQGSRVLYIAGYRDRADLFLPEAIEAAADTVIWCCESTPTIEARRPHDRTIVGTVIDGLRHWADERITKASADVAQAPGNGGTGREVVPAAVDRLIAIGSDRMMAAVAEAHADWLGGRLAAGHVALASVNSPMQCMMKGVCGQCVQRLRDPRTGAERHVFTCAAQDHPLAEIDFGCLAARLRQNGLQEKVTFQCIESGVRNLRGLII
ncbi:MAG: FAD-dependent oxidoreductase [Burkholderiaceae bacterium]